MTIIKLLKNQKITEENLNSFYVKHEIEKDYLRNIVRIDLKWSKLIRQLYQSRININMTEINKDIKKDIKGMKEISIKTIGYLKKHKNSLNGGFG